MHERIDFILVRDSAGAGSDDLNHRYFRAEVIGEKGGHRARHPPFTVSSSGVQTRVVFQISSRRRVATDDTVAMYQADPFGD